MDDSRVGIKKEELEPGISKCARSKEVIKE
jgi:hypothetical protein